MKKINLALVGYGTIGSGVYELLKKNKELLMQKTGIEFQIKTIVDKDLSKIKDFEKEGVFCTDQYQKALDDKEIDAVIELTGGIDFPFELFKKSMESNKHFITANKALLSDKLSEMFKMAIERKRHIGFEASVAGGIPIIQTLKTSLIGNRISSIKGIINGTTNYILTQMEEQNLSFEEALKQAQDLGFAEADPTLDINGGDAAAKISILASIAFQKNFHFKEVPMNGIESISLMDIQSAKELGFKIKLIAECAQDEKGKVELRVQPTLVPLNNPLSEIKNEFNAILVNSDFLGESMYYGKGAGSHPTASAVVADIVEIGSKELLKKEYNESFYELTDKKELKKDKDLFSRYFIRMMTKEQPGILASIAKVMANHKISISGLMQEDSDSEEEIPVIFTTHKASEEQFQKAFKEIRAFDFVKDMVFYKIIK